MIRPAALLLVLSAAPAVAGACGAPDHWQTLSPEGNTGFQAAMALSTKTPEVGTPFDLDLKVCSADDEAANRVSVDATMPAHKHGMNYEPQLSKTAEGEFKATGFLFHMPGLWQITVSVYGKGDPSHLSMEIDVP